MSIRKFSWEESRSLYGFLSSEQRPLCEIIKEFNSTFSPPRHFTLCSHLTNLLQDKKALNTTERLIAFALLVEAYSSQKHDSNPLASS